VTNKFAFPMLLDLKPYVAARAAPRAPGSSRSSNDDGNEAPDSSSSSSSQVPSQPKKGGGKEKGKESSSSIGVEGAVPVDRSMSLETAWRNVQRDVLVAKHLTAATSPDAPAAASSIISNETSDGNALSSVDPLLYDLVGVVLHSGTGHGGHYISLVYIIRASVRSLIGCHLVFPVRSTSHMRKKIEKSA